jgi:hypothetical protein
MTIKLEYAFFLLVEEFVIEMLVQRILSILQSINNVIQSIFPLSLTYLILLRLCLSMFLDVFLSSVLIQI